MLDIRVHNIGEYELLNKISITVGGYIIEVHKGFRWDMASIPRRMWEEIGCPIEFALESLVHDAIYRTHLLSRKMADKIFHELLLRNGHSRAKAKAMYLGVRFGGSEAYDDGKYMIGHYRDYVSIMPVGRK